MLFAAFLGFPCTPVQSRVVGAAVIPHGDFAYDPALLPEGSEERDKAQALHSASLAAGRYIDELSPTLLVLTTPHGVALDVDFAVLLNSEASGYALIGGDLIHRKNPLYKVPLSFNMDAMAAADLLKHLKGSGTTKRNVSGISSFADSEAQAVRWAEVVPLSFLSNTTLNAARVLILSMPTRRYGLADQMVTELLELGGALFRYFEASDERVALVTSADLAHTHLAEGPYGFSKAAAPFDSAMGAWAQDPAKGERWLTEVGARLVGRALSCGFPGLVLLQGALRKAPGRWRATLLANAYPTYYGMLAATF